MLWTGYRVNFKSGVFESELQFYGTRIPPRRQVLTDIRDYTCPHVAPKKIDVCTNKTTHVKRDRHHPSSILGIDLASNARNPWFLTYADLGLIQRTRPRNERATFFCVTSHKATINTRTRVLLIVYYGGPWLTRAYFSKRLSLEKRKLAGIIEMSGSTSLCMTMPRVAFLQEAILLLFEPRYS